VVIEVAVAPSERTVTTWTDLSDRPENPRQDDDFDSLYSDSLDSCDSEVASLDDEDLCPLSVHAWVTGNLIWNKILT